MKEPQHGDHYFLFTNLSLAGELYDQLPILLSSGVYLVLTLYHTVAQRTPIGSSLEYHIGLGAWVYPGHGLGLGQCHASLKVDSSHTAGSAQRYAAMVGTLYLAKPIHMAIG